jgi:tRNA(Phe) wybutosine-synthesizing methylase Tyw3
MSVARPESRIKVLSAQLFEKDAKDHDDAFRILKVEPSAGHKGSHIESCERRKVTGLHCLRYAESSIG